MTQAEPEILPPITDPSVHLALDALARRHREASGPGIRLLTQIGGSAEQVLGRLPGPLRDQLEALTRRGLNAAVFAAAHSGRPAAGRSDAAQRAIMGAVGAVGGATGLTGAVAEMPVTITMLLRTILGIAAEHGFDPTDPETRAEALRIFAAAGPLEDDDGADLGLMTTRLTVTGQSLQGLIARVAPRFSAVLGQKLAAQSAPVLGAVAGASVNVIFTRYYQDMARVHFGLLRLARETDLPRAALLEALKSRISPPETA